MTDEGTRRPYAPRPDGYAAELTGTELAAVIAAFGIGPARTVSPAGGRAVSRRAVVTAGSTRYVVKQVPWYCDHRPHADGVAAVQDRLARTTGLVPALRRTTDGSLLAAIRWPDRRERLFTMQRLVAGTPWRPVPDDCTAAGRVCGRLHDAMRSAPVVAAAGAVIRHRLFDTVDRALSRLAADGAPRGRPWPRRQLVTLRALLLDAAGEAGQAGYDAVWRLVHGDVNPANLLFGSDREVRAVVDWDNCCWDHPAHDVARAMAHVGWLQAGGDTDRFCARPSAANPELAFAFLAGYRQSCPEWSAVRATLGPVLRGVVVELVALGALSGWFSPDDAQAWIDAVPAVAGAVSRSPEWRDDP